MHMCPFDGTFFETFEKKVIITSIKSLCLEKKNTNYLYVKNDIFQKVR